MATLAAGNHTEVYAPLEYSITITPGSGGHVEFGCSSPSATPPAPRRIHAAESITIPPGSTIFMRAEGADATYLEPSSGSSTVITSYTAAQLAAMALAGELTTDASYRASDTGARYHADDAYTLVPDDFAEYSPIAADTYGSGLTGRAYSPAFVRSIGASNAVAAAIEAFSEAMPKNARWNTPYVSEQGVIELAPIAYTLEKTLTIDLSGVSTSNSRYGLTIRGCGPATTLFYCPTTSSPANFKAGDGIWRGVTIKSDYGHGIVRNLRISGIGLMAYFTQGGDGSTRLTDPLRLWEFQQANMGRFESLVAYSRNSNPLSMDQYGFAFTRCYYSTTRDLEAVHFPHINGGISMNGNAGPRACGVGYLFSENNAMVHYNPIANQCNLGFHLVNENGISMWGGSVELCNKTMLIDEESYGNTVRGLREEFHWLDSASCSEDPAELYSVVATPGTRDNTVVMGRNTTQPKGRAMVDLSPSQSNELHGPDVRGVQNATNLLKAWSLDANVTVAASTDIPPGAGVTSSVEMTFDGVASKQRYQLIKNINPDCGSLTFSAWAKRVSGVGIPAPALWQAGGGTAVFWAYFMDPSVKWQNYNSVPLAASGHSWAAGVLTLVTKAWHGYQAGMRTTSGGIYGDSGNQVPASTALSIVSVTPLSISVSWAAGDPGTISSPAALTISSPSPDRVMMGQPDFTADWVRISGRAQIRWAVIGLSLDGSDHPVLNFAAQWFVQGAKLRLSGFKDSRMNGVLHTVGAGDVSGNNITISSLTLGDLDVSTAAAVGMSQITDYYGYAGHTEVWMRWRSIGVDGSPFVWRVAGESLVEGAANPLTCITADSPQYNVQVVASSAAPNLDCSKGPVVAFTATSAATWGAPSNVPPAGETVTVTVTQDGTGGYAISWNAAYIFPTAWSNTGNTANKKSTVNFVSDGVKLVAQGANSWY